MWYNLVMSEVIERNQENVDSSIGFQNQDGLDLEPKRKRKISAKSLANLIPAKKGQILNPKGGKIKTLETRIIERKVEKALTKANTLAKLQSPHALRRVVKISKGETLGAYSAEHMRTVLSANEAVLNRAGVGVQKSGVGVAVQINFADSIAQRRKELESE